MEIIELNFMILEKNIPNFHNSIFIIITSIPSSLGISLKLGNFLVKLALISNSNKKCEKCLRKWFYLLIKIIRKKLNLFYLSIPYKANLSVLTDYKYICEEKRSTGNLSWILDKYLRYNKNNIGLFWKISRIFFSCILCKKIVAVIDSGKFFEFTNLFQKNLLFLKFLKTMSVSNLSICNFCEGITKISKGIVFFYDNSRTLEYLIFLNEKFRKNNIKIKNKKLRISEFCSNHKKILFTNQTFFINIFSEMKYVYKITILDKLSYRHYFQTLSTFFTHLDSPEKFKSLKESKERSDSVLSISFSLYSRVNRYKISEITFLNLKNEKLHFEVNF